MFSKCVVKFTICCESNPSFSNVFVHFYCYGFGGA